MCVVDLTAEPSQPAPGSHNAELYPELDLQPIPPDMREKAAAILLARERQDIRQGKTRKGRETPDKT